MFLRHKLHCKDGNEHPCRSIIENRRVSGGGRCSDTCCIWARSTTASAPLSARRSRRSTRGAELQADRTAALPSAVRV
jgi:hypothetical protein